MFRIRAALLVLMIGSQAQGEVANTTRFADEALDEVDKLLQDAVPEQENVESYVDCKGERVYIQRADQNCPTTRRRYFVVEPVHSIVATYCLREKEQPSQSEDLKAYFTGSGLAQGWVLTTRRPTKNYLRTLRCRVQIEDKTS